MTQILNVLLPVFILVGLGYGLARKGFIGEVFLNELNRLLFWVCLPALIIHSLATAESIPAGTADIILVFLIASSIVLALGFPACRALNLERHRVGTFIQSAFRGNLGYTGLPIIYFAFRDQGEQATAEALAQAIFLLAPAMLHYNAGSVFLLLGSQQSSFFHNLPATFIKVARNPLIVASAIGVMLFFLPFPLPRFLLNSIDLVGQIAAPASLLCVGGGMAYVSMEGRYRSASVASLMKVALLPVLTWLLALPFNLDPAPLKVLLIFSACPTAVASYIMTKEMKGDTALSAGCIVISTVLSFASLGLVLALT